MTESAGEKAQRARRMMRLLWLIFFLVVMAIVLLTLWTWWRGQQFPEVASVLVSEIDTLRRDSGITPLASLL
jgi:hypothetical protein